MSIRISMHLGVHKTASTLLQKTMQLNKDALNKIGCYPIVRDRHRILKNALRRYLRSKTSLADVRKVINKVLLDCNKVGCNHILISDENLLGDIASLHISRKGTAAFYPKAAERIAMLKKLFSDLDREWILYTREQHTLIPSIYKDGLSYFRYAYTLDEFCTYIDPAEFRFNSLVERIKKVIDSDKLHLQKFESIHKGSRAYVESYLGLSDIAMPKKQMNVSISPYQVDLFRKSYGLTMTPEEKKNMSAWIRQAPELKSFSTMDNTIFKSKFVEKNPFQDDLSYRDESH